MPIPECRETPRNDLWLKRQGCFYSGNKKSRVGIWIQLGQIGFVMPFNAFDARCPIMLLFSTRPCYAHCALGWVSKNNKWSKQSYFELKRVKSQKDEHTNKPPTAFKKGKKPSDVNKFGIFIGTGSPSIWTLDNCIFIMEYGDIYVTDGWRTRPLGYLSPSSVCCWITL